MAEQKFTLPTYSYKPQATTYTPTIKSYTDFRTEQAAAKTAASTLSTPSILDDANTGTVSATDQKIASLEAQLANLEERLAAQDETVDSRSAIEKYFNLPQDQGMFLDALDILDKPLQALYQGVTDKSLSAAWEGWRGQRERMSGSEFIDNIGLIDINSLNDTQRLLLDIGVDMAADPLNYIAPTTILKKLGILSDVKLVAKYDDAVRAIRASSLADDALRKTDDWVRAGNKLLGLDEGFDLLNNLDNLDDLQLNTLFKNKEAGRLIKNIDTLDAKDMKKLGKMLNEADVIPPKLMSKVASRYGQFVDDAGRILFKFSDEAEAAGIRQLFYNPETGIKHYTDLIATYTDDLSRATTPEARATAKKLLDEATASQQKALEEFKKVSAYTNTAQTAEDAQRIADEVPNLKAQFKKAGSVGEGNSTIEMRRTLEQNYKDLFGDNVSVLVGDVRATDADALLYYRTESGAYVKVKTVEIKDSTYRYSISNEQLHVVDQTSIDLAEKEAKIIGDAKGLESPEYIAAHNDYLEQVQLFAQNQGAPTLRVTPNVKKYNHIKDPVQRAEAIRNYRTAINKKLQKISELTKDANIPFSTYVEGVQKYINKLDELMKGKKWTNLADSEKKAIRAAAKEAMKDAGLDTLKPTYTQAIDYLEGVAQNTDELEMLKDIASLEIGKKSDTLYAVYKQGATEAEKKIIYMTGDDFFKYQQFQELSIQTVVQKGKKQITAHTYSTLDMAKLEEEIGTGADNLLNRNLEVMNEALGVTETAASPRTLIGVDREFKPGLVVKFMNKLGKTNIPFIAPAANVISESLKGIKMAFNSTAGLPKDMIADMARLSADGQQTAKIAVRRYEAIVKDLTKELKKVGKYTDTEIRDSISFILENLDNIRTANGDAFFNKMLLQYDNFGKAILPEMTEVQLKNLLTTLDRALVSEGYAVADLFTISLKEGFAEVTFNADLTVQTFKEIVDGLNPKTLETVFDFGKAQMSPLDQTIFRDFRGQIDEMLSEQQKIYNILEKELGYEFAEGLLGTGSFMRHSVDPEMLKHIQKNSPASIKKFLDAGTDTLRDRKYLGSVRELNAGLKEILGININTFSTNAAYNFADLVRVTMTKQEMGLVLKEIMTTGDSLGKKIFEVVDDSEVAVRGMRSEFKILNNSFKAEFSNLFKNLSPNAQAELLKYFADAGYIADKSVIAIQKSAYGILKRLDNAYVVLPDFVKGYDKFMGQWKTLALLTPGYHMRNFIGNITNSFMAGMPLPMQSLYLGKAANDFSEYGRVLRALSKGDDIGKFSKRTQEAFKRVDDYFRSGASQSHKGVRDLEIIKEATGRNKGGLLNPIINMNYKAAEHMDDFQRYALYQWSLTNATKNPVYKEAARTGASVAELGRLQTKLAYEKVAESLFDYSHLTPFEQEYMKRIFPFYTFFKNNLIFQTKMMITNPQRFSRLGRTYRYYVEDMTGMDIGDLPDYMVGNLWIPMPYKVTSGDEEAIRWLRANLPPSDFTEFIENPFARGVTSVTVPIKMIIEYGTGRDTFTGQPLTDFPGEKSIYTGEGALASLRDSSGRITLSQNPYVIKFLNDIGLRSLISYGTSALDFIDYKSGVLTKEELTTKLSDSLGLTRDQTLTDLQIASIYQNIDKARDEVSLWEQTYGDLPTLDELAKSLEDTTPTTSGIQIPTFGG